MAVTKSWEQRVVITLDPAEAPAPEERRQELPWLVGASVMVLAGLLMAGFAKTQNFPDLEARLARGELLNLNTIQEPDQLRAFLSVFPPEQRQAAAERIWGAIELSR